jgi:hypothetical protein
VQGHSAEAVAEVFVHFWDGEADHNTNLANASLPEQHVLSGGAFLGGILTRGTVHPVNLVWMPAAY